MRTAFLFALVSALTACGARDQLLVGEPLGGGAGGAGGGGAGGAGGGGAGGGGAGGGGMGGGGTGGAPISIPVVEQLALGARHTCVLGADATVWCWGDNSQFQLGVSIGPESLAPVRVASLPPATQLAAGYDHTCAVVLQEAGPAVWCWGGNNLGEVIAVPTDAPVLPSPVPGTEGAEEVAAGQFHTCARANGQIVCWGDNEQGQLGDGSVGGTTTGLPTLVQDGGVALTGLALGAHHACAEGGAETYCWGENIDGELGVPPPGGSAVPVPVAAQAMGFLSSKGHFTCGLAGQPDPSGPICWGDNDSGQLALGVKSSNELPTFGTPVSQPLALAAAITHACALALDGTVHCWGANYNGQLGIPGADSYVPQKVPSLSDVEHVAAGTLHTCVAKAQPGAVWCWGGNDFGQLGSGTKNASAIPVAVVWPD